MPGSSRTGSVGSPERRPYRILLDQNFPKPPGFDISDVDQTVEVVHLADFDSALAKGGIPDWFIYVRAAEGRFSAVVTRDHSQLDLPEELWVLTRINLTLISFRKPIEDPIVEWGQLLAYLPLIRRRDIGRTSQILLLPRPDLTSRNLERPRDLLHQIADELGVSVQQVRREAEANVRDYLEQRDPGSRRTQLLRMS